MIDTKLPPFDLRAEEGVTGSLIIDSDCYSLVRYLTPDDFFDEPNRLVFQACQNIIARNGVIDEITVAEELERTGKLELAGGAAYIPHLVSITPTSLDIEHYAEIVHRLSISRAMIQAASQIASIGFESSPDTEGSIKKIENIVTEVRKHSQGGKSDIVTPKDMASRMQDMIQKGESSLEWGFTDLDTLTCGVYPQDYIVVGARPSVGKCVASDTLVCDSATGALVTIKEWGGRQCFFLNGNLKIESKSPIAVYNNGQKECYKVTTSSGRSVTTTFNHPFLTGDGWMPLFSINLGDLIATPRVIPVFGKTIIGEYRARILGYLLSDGGLTQDVRFTNDDKIILDDMRLCLSKEFSDCEMIYSSQYDYRIVKKTRTLKIPNPVKMWLEDLGVFGKRSKDKVLPALVLQLCKRDLANFLRAFYSCDGGKERTMVSTTLASQILVRQLQHLLLRFGILSQVHYKEARCNNKTFDSWRLTISDRTSVIQYWDSIGFIGKKSTFQIKYKYQEQTNQDYLPLRVWDLIKSECTQKGTSLSNIERIRRGALNSKGINPHYKTRHITRGRLNAYANILDSQLLKNWASSDIFWDKVVSIEPIGLKDTCDLTIGKDHNFVASDIFLHNTQFMLDCAENIAKQGKKVLFASVEMTINPIIERYIAKSLGISVWDYRKRNTLSDQWQQVEEKYFNASVALSRLPIYYLFERRSSDSIWDNARKMEETIGLDIVFVDYLQLLSDCYRGGRDNHSVSVGLVSHNLKAITTDLNIPVVVASQLNRLVEYRDDKHPVLADLRESGDIEQDADVVFLLHRPELYIDPGKISELEAVKGKLSVMMAKNRQLGTATHPVVLQWIDKQFRYGNASEGM